MVWPDMADSWRLFMAMATQWKTAGMAGLRTGLEYTALPGVAASLGIPFPLEPQTFADLRLLEAEALNIWSRRNGGTI